MNLFDLLVLAAICAAVFAHKNKANRATAPSIGGSGKPQAQADADAKQKAPPFLLNIEGTTRLDSRQGYGFVKAFGLRADQVQDVVQHAGPLTLASLPSSLRDCLMLLYRDGGLHGQEMVELLFREGSLSETEAVTFAAVVPSSHHPAYVVGFVDRRRI